MKDYILVSGTNGEGYSDVTVKRLKTIDEALAYVSNFFLKEKPHIEGTDGKISFSTTTEDDEENTHRVTIFEVQSENIILVKADALITEYEVSAFAPNGIWFARGSLKKQAAELITEPDEENTTDISQGEGEDDFYHFEIVRPLK